MSETRTNASNSKQNACKEQACDSFADHVGYPQQVRTQGLTTPAITGSTQTIQILGRTFPHPRGVGAGSSPTDRGKCLIDYFDVERADALARHAGSYGCAAHRQADCLCDVVVESPTPITDVPPCLWNFDGRLDFIRLAELMMGRVDLIDIDRIDAGHRNLPEITEETFEWLWTTAHDPTITQDALGEAIGLNGSAVSAMCQALNIEWVGGDRCRNPKARAFYIELRDEGVAHQQAWLRTNERFGMELNDQTARKWYSMERTKRRVAAMVAAA